MMGIPHIKGKNDKSTDSMIILDMSASDPRNRPSLEKVWKYLKSKEN